MRPGTAPTDAGLYVHVPFCLTRCGYCDFNAYADLGHLAERYVEAVRVEADRAAPEWDGVGFASIYLGGGTPEISEHLNSCADCRQREIRLRGAPDLLDLIGDSRPLSVHEDIAQDRDEHDILRHVGLNLG